MPSNTGIQTDTDETIVTKQRSHDGDTAQQQMVGISGVTGTEDSYTFEDIAGTAANGLEVDVTRVQGTVTVDGSGVTQPVSGTITANLSAADNAVLDNIQTSVDTLAAAVSTEFQVDVVGALPAGANTIGEITIGAATTAAGDLAKAEDAAHTSGDVGVMSLGVRNDTRGSLSGADGDYTPPQFNSSGDLRVEVASVNGAQVDDAAFGVATDSVAVIGALADETATDSVDEGDAGAVRMSLRRALYMQMETPNGDSPWDDTNDALQVNVVAGGAAGGTSAADDADFTAGTTAGTPAMGVYESSPTSVTDGDLGTVGITQTRSMKVEETNSAAILADTASMDANLGTVAGAVSAGQMQVDIVADGAGLLTTTAHDAAFGTAGTADAQVRSVQGIASMTPLLVDATGQGNVPTTVEADVAATGTSTYYDSDLDETEVDIDAGPVNIYSIQAFNTTAAPLFLQMFNTNTVTVGTTTPTNQYVIPGNADSDGAGFSITFGVPKTYGTAFTVACTTDSEGNGAPGNGACIVNIEYAT